MNKAIKAIGDEKLVIDMLAGCYVAGAVSRVVAVKTMIAAVEPAAVASVSAGRRVKCRRLRARGRRGALGASRGLRPDQAVQLVAGLVAALGEVLPFVEQVALLGR
ncbi:hypothetical protein ACFXJ5_03195 [Streptomyces sp. NPDC059373]